MTERLARCGKPTVAATLNPGTARSLSPVDPQGDGKTVTRLMSDEQLDDYGPWIDNERRLRSLVAELESLSLGIVEPIPLDRSRVM